MERYFLAIIGGGPAGYTAAEKASKAGKDVVLFEQNAVGGTCLNVGCIPTKSLLYGAKQYYNATHATKYGVTADNVSFDFAAMQKRKTIVVRKLVAGIKARLNNDHCTLVSGFAKVENRTDECVTIGHDTVVGGNIWLTQDVPANSIVLQSTPEIRIKNKA